jgi:hypothetical protein
VSGPSTAVTAARFLVEAAALFAERGVRIKRILTDNAKAYAESVGFAEAAAGLGIRRKRTRHYRPQTNGNVERFNKTLLDQWAYARLYRSNAERRRAFAGWLRFHNHRRPHLARRPDPDGGPRQQPSREPQLAWAGLPHIRFHDQRHSAATLLLGLGIHPKIVSENLGHSQIGITLDLYSHVTVTMQQEAVRAFDGLFGSQFGSQEGATEH